MAVNEDGEVAGSVSGGCVEGAVVGEALQLLDHHVECRQVVAVASADASVTIGDEDNPSATFSG